MMITALNSAVRKTFRNPLKTGWAALFAAALAASAPATHAQDINTFPQWNGTSFINSWGFPNTATYGETFKLTQGSFLPSFTFALSHTGGAAVNYQAFIYAWDGTKIVGPALFASSVLTAPAGAGFQNVTVNTNGLSLAPGSYVAFFTTSNTNNPANGGYKWGAINSNTPYPDGEFVFFNNGTNFNALFGSSWITFPEDLAFLIKLPIPAQIHVNGNYSLAPYSSVFLHIGGTGKTQFDNLTIDGTASLNGTLLISSLNGFKMRRGDSFKFISANGGVSGKFATVVDEFAAPGTILDPQLVYSKHSVTLEVPTFESFGLANGFTPNEISVAQALDSLNYDSRENKLITFLDNRNVTKLPRDFDKIAPDELTSIFTIGVSLAQVQSGNIQRRTDDIRSGSNGFSAAGFAITGTSPSYSGSFGIQTGVTGPSGNDGKESKEVKNVVAPAENRWGAFLSGTGEWVSVGDTDNARGYNLESGGFTLGVDYKFAPNFAVGIAAGYTGTTADLTDGGRVYVNGGKIGLYATFFQNEQVATQAPTMSKDSSKDSKEVQPPTANVAKGLYADLAVFGGYNSYDFHRSALEGTARGDTDGGELNVLVGTGYDFKMGNCTFGPTASFNYTYIGTNEFTEHGSLAPLDIHGAKGDSLRTAFGIKASYDWKVGSVVIKPEIRAAWQHEYGDVAYDLTSSFANGGGDPFTVAGPKIGRDSALLGAGFAVQFSERCGAYVYYDGELGRTNYQSTAVTGGFRLSF